MNKLFALVIFCVLNSSAMEAPLKTAAPESQLSIRGEISLNEALRLGTLVAKENEIEFADFESSPTFTRPLFSIPLRNVNSYIYSLLTKIFKDDYYEKAKIVEEKILQKTELNEQDVLDYQIPLVHIFFSNFDLTYRDRTVARLIHDNDTRSLNEKNVSCALLYRDNNVFALNRCLYKAALAAQNVEAINIQRSKQMYFDTPQTIVQRIAELYTITQEDKPQVATP